MHGIYLTAIFTSAAAVAFYGTLIHKLRLPANERLLWLAFAIALPLQPLAFYCVRVPLDHLLLAQLGSDSLTYKWLVTLYAPLTEEPAKLIPLLIPALRRDLNAANFVRYALAIGLGFAIGEMWFVAHRVALMPAFASVPFYQFGGYVTERLMNCLFHGAFLSVALWRWQRRLALGFMGAAAMHWLSNFPLVLMAWHVGGLTQAAWAVILDVWLLGYFVAALVLLAVFAFGRAIAGKLMSAPGTTIFGQRRCPDCNQDYGAPLFAFHMGRSRYERCPHCQRWHWIKARSD